ncbi:Mitogen-activated protein kinase NTF3 [Tripterygium wilfordii]|uniref:Mitogen-activated protein kinase NTF3 n=1 Tax=Tripterygium wilfordii TaxID=458696 RepID=A0A7J7CZB4_TRIWF|nr:Mitogen-activated protein kinase NTF3 [Tripterygium wilfordii]
MNETTSFQNKKTSHAERTFKVSPFLEPKATTSSGMATPVEPPNGVTIHGKHYYSMWQTLFEIDTKYVPIKPIGRGAYGIREEDLEFIDNPKARKYIKTLPYSAGSPFSRLYPNAHPMAIDLLQKMLVFDPSKRISVTEALQHPYMSALYDSNRDPPAQVPIDLDIDEDLAEEMIREMMWKEILCYHPEVAAANGESCS